MFNDTGTVFEEKDSNGSLLTVDYAMLNSPREHIIAAAKEAKTTLSSDQILAKKNRRDWLLRELAKLDES